MKIYIDNIVLNFQKIGGISVYVTEIISRLVRDKIDLTLVEQSNVNVNILRNKLSIPSGQVILEKYLPLRLLSYLPIKIKLKEESLVHSSYYRICKDALAVNAITVYDFNYELGYVRQGIRKFLHCRQKKYAIEKADGIICISESTKRDLLHFFPHVNSSKIRVIHLAAGSVFCKSDTEKLTFEFLLKNIEIGKIRYILYVGSRDFHKNFNICIETLQKLAGYELFIVGSSLTAAEIQMLDSKMPSRYQSFSNLSSPDLNFLYNNAFCFFYPTSYEGFGIPVLEAMQAGCPVISTKCSSIPEVAGNAGLLVDNVSSDDFAEAILSLENVAFREKLIHAGFMRAKMFSWEKTYQETINFYNEIFINKFGFKRC